MQLPPGQVAPGSSWSDHTSLSVPHSHFCLIWEFFPNFLLVSSSWDALSINLLYLQSEQTLRIWILLTIALFTRYKRLPPGLNKINPPVSIPFGHSGCSFVSHLCVHTHLYTHLFTLTLFICHSTGPNITFHTPRPRILWCEAILKVSGSTLLTQNKLLLSRNPSNCIEWHPLAIIWYILWGWKKKKKRRDQ